MRLYFALWPDEAMQAALSLATREAVEQTGGQPVPPRNFHFTLAFLGSVSAERLDDLSAIAERVASAFRDVRRSTAPSSVPPARADGVTIEHRSVRGDAIAPISVTLDRLEHWRQSQILCATSTSEPAAAVALAETLKQQLTAAGFAPDLKSFRAHATLARKVHRVTHELRMAEVRWSFGSFHLVESQTAASGSTYSSRAKWVLDE